MRKSVFLIALMVLQLGLWAQSLVAINGRLQVKGTKLCNKDGVPIQLKGMSSHGLQWTNNCLKKSSIAALRKDWKSDVFRISMYVEESGYNTDTARFIAKVDSLVDWCTDEGLYAIIDWHILTPGDPLDPAYKGAFSFFSRMAKRFGKHENVLFELCNEPNGDMATWARIKQYAEPIIAEIRKYSQNIIIVGTPNWSQQIYRPAFDPIAGKNLMYTFHFYSSSHDGLKNMFKDEISMLPVFVTEWGPTAADGTSQLDTLKAIDWVKMMNDNQISWTTWSFSDLKISTSVLKEGSCADNARNNTTAEGGFMKRQIQAPKVAKEEELVGEPDSLIYAYASQNKIQIGISNIVYVKGLMNAKEFTVSVNGKSIPVTNVVREYLSMITLTVNYTPMSKDTVRISYSGKGSIEGDNGKLLKKCDGLLADVGFSPTCTNHLFGTGFYTNFDSTKMLLPLVNSSDFDVKLINKELSVTGLGKPYWASVYFRIPTSDISKNLKISFSIKTNSADSIWINYFDTLNRISDPYGPMKVLIADNKYHTYTFDCSRITNEAANKTCIKQVGLFINPPNAYTKSIMINQMWVGDSVAFAPIKGAKLKSHTLSLKAEEQVKLGVDYLPENIFIPEVWVSLNPAVASVSNLGEVRGIAEGSTRVVAYWFVNDKRITDTCVVTVNNGGDVKRKRLIDAIAVADSIKMLAEGTTTQAVYKATSIANLAKVIADAKLLANATLATQKGIDSMVVVLNDSLVAMCRTGKSNDYTVLRMAIQHIDFALLDVTVGTRAGEFPAKALADLKVIKENALGILKINPTPKQLDSATLAVETAITAFRNSKIAQTANYRALDSLLAVARNIYDTTIASKYPKAEYNLFSNSIDKALQVDYNFGATQDEINKAQADLQLSIETFKTVQQLTVVQVLHGATEATVHAYPNPFVESFTIQTTVTGVKKLVVVGLLGKEVYETSFDSLEQNVMCTELAPGVYVVKLTMPDGQQVVLQLAK